MESLYELTNQFLQVLEIMDDPEVDPADWQDTLEGIQGEIEVKADGYARVIRTIEHKVAAYASEIERLASRKKTAEKNINRLKKNLQDSMEAIGRQKIKTDLFSFNIQKNPASVVLDEQNIANIPAEYLLYQEPKINKDLIKSDLKEGKDLKGIAHLEQGCSLRIR